MTAITTRITRAIWTLSLLAIGASVGAQPRQHPPCFALVQTALQAADAACEATGRNEVCYGNVSGVVTPAPGVSDVVFDQVGDIAPVDSIRALQLSPLDEVKQEWGVAIMRLQANLPDTLPGQNVTFVLFGDVTIEDATEDQVRVEGQVREASNVRHLPSIDAEVIGSLRRGQTAIVTGKAASAEGGLWYRVKYDNYHTRTGWVLSELIDVDPDLLPEVERTSLVANPMQAFYFRTGIGRQTCYEAPADGVVVQTPEGVGMVSFNVNGVDVSLGSTAVITDTGGGLSFALMEGRGMVRAQSVTRVLVPGSETVVPMDAQYRPADAPTIPRPITPEMFTMASEAMEAMDRPVVVPPPATLPMIERANSAPPPVLDDIRLPSCPPGTDPAQCACNDVDGDGACDAVPCSERYPTMCIPNCADRDGDGKCDIVCEDRDTDGVCDPALCIDADMDGACDSADCEDRDGDGQCDVLDPCVVGTTDCECEDVNNNGVCDTDESVCTTPNCLNCPDYDADGECDDSDPCVDSDEDGECDDSDLCEDSDDDESCNVSPTPTVSGGSPSVVRTPTPTPTSGI